MGGGYFYFDLDLKFQAFDLKFETFSLFFWNYLCIAFTYSGLDNFIELPSSIALE